MNAKNPIDRNAKKHPGAQTPPPRRFMTVRTMVVTLALLGIFGLLLTTAFLPEEASQLKQADGTSATQPETAASPATPPAATTDEAPAAPTSSGTSTP